MSCHAAGPSTRMACACLSRVPSVFRPHRAAYQLLVQSIWRHHFTTYGTAARAAACACICRTAAAAPLLGFLAPSLLRVAFYCISLRTYGSTAGGPAVQPDTAPTTVKTAYTAVVANNCCHRAHATDPRRACLARASHSLIGALESRPRSAVSPSGGTRARRGEGPTQLLSHLHDH